MTLGQMPCATPSTARSIASAGADSGLGVGGVIALIVTSLSAMTACSAASTDSNDSPGMTPTLEGRSCTLW